MQTCQRCYQPAFATIMSMFNTQTICLDCSAKERQHPDFKAAREADEAAIKQGNYNFRGVGRPSGL